MNPWPFGDLKRKAAGGMNHRVEKLADGVELHLGDCREILLGLDHFDAVITDPVWPNAPDGMFPDVDDPCALLRSALSLVRPARIAIIIRSDSDPRFLTAVPARFRFVRHQNLFYACPGHIGRVLGGIEVVYGFGSVIPSRPGQRVIAGNGPTVQPSEKFDHPCQRNIEHMKFVVRWWSEPEEFILDPFMGSGTTGVAAVKLSRRFTGIEIEPRYFDIACRRIEAALKQPDFFVERPAPAKQEAFEI